MGFFDEMNSRSTLTSKINKLNQSISQNYSELGTRYYNLYKNNPDPKFAELIDEITSAYAEIKIAEEQLAFLRGVVFCPNCKAECNADLRFCIHCGTQLQKPIMPQPVAQQPVYNNYAQAAPVEQPVVNQQPVYAPQSENVSEATQQPVQQEFIFCTQCGQKLLADSAFCTNCGKSLK